MQEEDLQPVEAPTIAPPQTSDPRDLSSVNDIATSTPEEAAKNIDHAGIFGMDPSGYKNFSEELDPKAEALKKPVDTTPIVGTWAKQSTEHAAVASPDIDKLSFMEKQAMLWGDYAHNRPNVAQQIIALSNKKMNDPENFTPDDSYQLYDLNQRQREFPEHYGLNGPLESVEKVLIGGAEQAGEYAAAGIRGMFVGGKPLPGMGLKLIGALIGTRLYTYHTSAGAAYNELDNAVDPKTGERLNLDENVKRNYARGLGIVSTAVQTGMDAAAIALSPLAGKFVTPSFAKMMITSPTNAAIAKTVELIGQQMAIGYAGGGANEAAKIVAQQIAKDYNGTDASILNSLGTVVSNLPSHLPRIAQAAEESATQQGILGGAAAIAGFPALRKGFRMTGENFQRYAADRFQRPYAYATDVTGFTTDVHPEALNASTELTPDIKTSPNGPPQLPGGSDPVRQASKVIYLSGAIDNIEKVAEQTNMAKVAPQHLSDLKKNIYEKSGMKYVWINWIKPQLESAKPESIVPPPVGGMSADQIDTPLRTTTDAELFDANHKELTQYQRVLNKLDPTGGAAANAPIKVETHRLGEIIKEFPETKDLIQAEPDGPSLKKAKEYLQKMQEAHDIRGAVLAKFGLTQDEKGAVTVPENYDQSNITKLIPRRSAPIDVAALEKEKAENLAYIERRGKVEPRSEGNVTKLKEPKLSENRTATVENLKKRNEEIDAQIEASKQEAKVIPFSHKEIADTVEKHISEAEQALTPTMGPHGMDWTGKINQSISEYLDQDRFEALKGLVPEATLEKWKKADFEARDHVHMVLQEIAGQEMLQLKDLEMEAALDTERKTIADQLARNPGLALVDKFRAHVVADKKGNKAISEYAIDPKFLTDAQIDSGFTPKNPQLKDHKVFAKGGKTPDESAKLLIGPTATGYELLKILSRTPTREQITTARLAAMGPALEHLVTANLEPDFKRLDAAYNDKITNARNELDYFLSDEYPAFAKIGKKLMLPIRSNEQIQQQATEMIKKTPVGELNVNQYKVMERRSNREVSEAFFKGHIEQAAAAKQNSILAIELQKQTIKAIARSNRLRDFALRFEDPLVRNMLANAGPMFEKAANELLDSFDLDPRKRKTKNFSPLSGESTNDYTKWVQNEFNNGRGDFKINPLVADPRQRADDMTYEALDLVGSRLVTIFTEAKHVDALWNELEKGARGRTFDDKVSELVTHLESHPDFNPKKNIPKVQKGKPSVENRKWWANLATSMDAFKHIAMTMDQEKALGLVYQTFVESLTGEGEFKNKQGFSADVQDRKVILERLHKSIEALGKKEWRDLQITWLNIPEFADLPNFNNGEMTKGDLMSVAAHFGDPHGREKLVQMGASIETMMQVFTRELDHKHMEFLTNYMWEVPKSYQGRIARHQKDITGADVTFIKGVPFDFKGKTYPGGYVHQDHVGGSDERILAQTIEDLESQDTEAATTGSKNVKYFARNYAAETTDQGYLESRRGSKDALDLSFNRMIVSGPTMIIHDLNYRKPVMDNLKLLRDPDVKKAMISVAGLQKWRIMANATIATANQMDMAARDAFSDQTGAIKKLMSTNRSRFSLSHIGGNLTSFLVQPVSVPAALLGKMGALNGMKHLSVITTKMMNPKNWESMQKFAASLDTSIEAEQHEIADSITSTFYDLLPQRDHPTDPFQPPLARALRVMNKQSMGIIQKMDNFIKTVSAAALYRQFRAGDAPGYSVNELSKLKDSEIEVLATRYAAQISELSLTRGHEALDKAEVQKDPRLQAFSYFMNDARQVYNSMQGEVRKIKYDVKGGDYKGAAGKLLSFFMLMVIARILEDKTRGYATPVEWIQQYDLKTGEGQLGAAEMMAQYMLLAPFDIAATVIPGVREIHYAADVNPINQNKVLKQATTPTDAMLTSGATVYSVLSDILAGNRRFNGPADLAKQEIQQFLEGTSYIIPWPVRGVTKAMKAWDSFQQSSGPITLQMGGEIGAAAELQDEIKKTKEANAATPAFQNDLDKLNDKLSPTAGRVPEDTYATIKRIEQGDEWKAMNRKEGAAGPYQFTSGEWDKIRTAAPELGLTASGRTSTDPKEQEKAMRWQTEHNAEQLGEKGIPSDAETLFSAHVFGVDKTVQLYQQAGDTKAKTVLSPDDLKGLNGFTFLKTVGQVRKAIKSQVNQNRLTVAQ